MFGHECCDCGPTHTEVYGLQDQVKVLTEENASLRAEVARLQQGCNEFIAADQRDAEMIGRVNRENHALRAERDALRAALLRLRAEVPGMLAMERDAIVALVSLTNVRCMERRIADADAALALGSSVDEGRQ